jgi:hypothetical protein
VDLEANNEVEGCERRLSKVEGRLWEEEWQRKYGRSW